MLLEDWPTEVPATARELVADSVWRLRERQRRRSRSRRSTFYSGAGARDLEGGAVYWPTSQRDPSGWAVNEREEPGSQDGVHSRDRCCPVDLAGATDPSAGPGS